MAISAETGGLRKGVEGRKEEGGRGRKRGKEGGASKREKCGREQERRRKERRKDYDSSRLSVSKLHTFFRDFPFFMRTSLWMKV